jgi:hypothetical protein
VFRVVIMMDMEEKMSYKDVTDDRMDGHVY